MKISTILLTSVALFAFGSTGRGAEWNVDFDVARATSANLPVAAAGFAEVAARTSLAKPKCRKSKRRGGIRYKQPNFKIKAPVKSEADRLKEREGGLKYLEGKGLSPKPLLGRNPSKSKSPLKK